MDSNKQKGISGHPIITDGHFDHLFGSVKIPVETSLSSTVDGKEIFKGVKVAYNVQLEGVSLRQLISLAMAEARVKINDPVRKASKNEEDVIQALNGKTFSLKVILENSREKLPDSTKMARKISQLSQEDQMRLIEELKKANPDLFKKVMGI
jgi:hypothetical protein